MRSHEPSGWISARRRPGWRLPPPGWHSRRERRSVGEQAAGGCQEHDFRVYSRPGSALLISLHLSPEPLTPLVRHSTPCLPVQLSGLRMHKLPGTTYNRFWSKRQCVWGTFPGPLRTFGIHPRLSRELGRNSEADACDVDGCHLATRGSWYNSDASPVPCKITPGAPMTGSFDGSVHQRFCGGDISDQTGRQRVPRFNRL